MQPTRTFEESTASSYAYGDLVQLDTGSTATTHQVVEASSLSSGYLGVAADAASSVQGATRTVYMAYPDIEFKGFVKETITSSMVGQYRAFARDTSLGIDYLAVNSSAGDQRAQITEIGTDTNSKGPLGNYNDTNGYVAFRFLSEFTAFGKST